MHEAEIERVRQEVRADIKSIVNVKNYWVRWKLIQEIGLDRVYQAFELEPLNFENLKFDDYFCTRNSWDVGADIINAYIFIKESLYLSARQISELPNDLDKLLSLSKFNVSYNFLNELISSITNLTNLTDLDISWNHITYLPENLYHLSNLKSLTLHGNPIIDLSPLQCFPAEQELQVNFIKDNLPRRYWTKLSDWKPQWLLDEEDDRVKEKIIDRVGFDRVYQELDLKPLSLDGLKIETNYQDYEVDLLDAPIDNNYGYLDYEYDETILEEVFALEHERIKLQEDVVEVYYDYYPREIYEDETGKQEKALFYKTKILSAYASNSNCLSLKYGNISSIPDSIESLEKLDTLDLCGNYLNKIPKTLSKLSKLENLNISENKFTDVPEIIQNLLQLKSLNLSNNQISELPPTIANTSKLEFLDLTDNPINDLSVLQTCSDSLEVRLFNVSLPRRYWTKFSEWEPKWLLDEDNAEIRRALVQQIGYERICQELEAIEIDNWREYTLLKIDELQRIYNWKRDEFGWKREESRRDPMVLLKMTCPSTGHIHILRVPPNMTSAEAAITWVNHGIHPDRFAVQT